VGLAAVHPCILPSLRSGRCALQIVCPDDLSNRWVQIKTTLPKNKKPHKGVLLFWRRGWDSNPRRAINPCRFSRPVHSTALPPLRRSVLRRARILTDVNLITTANSCRFRNIELKLIKYYNILINKYYLLDIFGTESYISYKIVASQPRSKELAIVKDQAVVSFVFY
jgi:hypothetical protein